MKLVIFDLDKTTVDMTSSTPYDDIVDVTTGLKQCGSTKLLTTLKQKGLQIAFASDVPYDLARQITDTQFRGLADATYGGPASVAEQITSAMERFGATKDDCFYISGNAGNIKAAKSVGLYVIGATWDAKDWDVLTAAGPDRVIWCTDELLRAAGADTVHNYKQVGYIPKYWDKHIEEKIQQIHKNQMRAGTRSMSFGLISDIHWAKERPGYSGAILERVANACAIPYIFNGGDTVSGAGTCAADLLFTQLQGYSREFQNLESRMLMVQGNHDSAYSEFAPPRYYAQCITKAELYEYIFRYETKYPDRVISEDGSYFYVDNHRSKVRLIAMNPYDVPSDEVNEDGSAKYNKMRLPGYRQVQLEWFAKEALDVPSTDWTVVLCTHSNPATKILESDYLCRNEDVVLQIIKAYREGIPCKAVTVFDDIPDYNIDLACDFTGRGGEFAVWVSGHTHIDLQCVVDGTLCTSIVSDWNHQGRGLPFQRTGGTFREHAFDIFTIDTEKHKLYVTRVGAGDDREYDYTPRK